MRVLFLVAVAAASCSVASTAFAQAPPMKMGLWETTSVTNMQMPAGMPAGMGAPRTSTTQSCITPESWQKSMERMANPRGECTYQDKTITATGMTFAMTCTMRNVTSTTKGKVTFDSPEKATSNIHIEMAMPGMPGGGNMVTEIKGTTKYLGADCGSVKPYTDKMPGK
jgi:hypothetical protein